MIPNRIGQKSWKRNPKMKIRKVFGMLFAAYAYSAYGVTNVVHDAARDLVLNTANRNVYTNLYGGVWSYMRSTSYTGERTLMPGVRYRTDTETDASGANYWPNTEAGDLRIY